MTDNELLQLAISSGIVDITTIRNEIEMNERKKILDNHKYAIYESKGKWFTYVITKEGKKKLIKKSTREKIELAIVDHYTSLEVKPGIRKIFEKWIESKIRYKEIGEATVDRYYCDYDRFVKGSSLEQKPFYLLTKFDFTDFIKTSIAEKELTAKGYSNLRTLISGIMKYAKDIEETEISATQFFGDLQLSRKAFKSSVKIDSEQVFTDEEFAKIEEYCLNKKTSVNLAILFAFYTGVRGGELAALSKADVKEDYLNITKTEVHYKKNGREVYVIKDSPKTENGIREIVLTDEAKWIIQEVAKINDTDMLFVNDYGTAIHAYTCTHRLYKICDRLKIPRRSLHKCRKTFATKLINGGVDKTIVTKALGHSDISTTERYYYFNNRDKEAEKNQIKKAVNFNI